jgi:hypothetical protein
MVPHRVGFKPGGTIFFFYLTGLEPINDCETDIGSCAVEENSSFSRLHTETLTSSQEPDFCGDIGGAAVCKCT